jgi:prolyl 4-hydroxylase
VVNHKWSAKTGRPFPLKGRFMANVFIHFEPIGSTENDLVYGTTDLPPYVIRGSPEESRWRANNPRGHTIMKPEVVEVGSTEAHRAARDASLHDLQEILDAHKDVVYAEDSNGWLPLHEAVREGNLEVVKFLVQKGSPINARTKNPSGPGGSVLWWALQRHGPESDVVQYLQDIGATIIEPAIERTSDEL